MQTIPVREGHRFFEETSATCAVTNQMSEMPFDQLDLKRAIAGDERAMQRLWSQHAPHIDAVVRRLCGDPELAADISQEVWMQIFRALPSYRGDSQFGTWAHRIAVNRTLNALRKIRRIAKLEIEIEDDSAMTENEADRTFMAESIEQAMAKLSPGARAGRFHVRDGRGLCGMGRGWPQDSDAMLSGNFKLPVKSCGLTSGVRLPEAEWKPS